MYHFAKRLTTISSVLCFVDIIITVMFAFYFPNSGLDMSTIIISACLLVISCTIHCLMTYALRGLCDALEFNFVKDAEKTRELEQRIHILEETK